MRTTISVLMAVFTLAAGSTSFADGFISGTEARRMIAEKGAILIDVRTDEEYGERHIAGAFHIPVSIIDLEARVLGDFDRPIIVYCQSGKRAAVAKDVLEKHGFKLVFNMGGIDNWDN